MRIIDKNTDYYDFYQNVYRDNTFTFDRRNSFLLTKQIVCDNLDTDGRWNYKTKKREPKKFNYALLQICNTFWLFLIEVTDFKRDYGFIKPLNYNIQLLASWKDFDKTRQLCSFELIRFSYYNIKDTKDAICKNINNLVDAIKINDYKIRRRIDRYGIYDATGRVEKTIPILKACGVANLIDAHDIYLAFEEYFSLEKTVSERREPVGTTDIDKVESHGFDKKTSFRGK